MKSSPSSRLVKSAILGCMLALVIWLAVNALSLGNTGNSQIPLHVPDSQSIASSGLAPKAIDTIQPTLLPSTSRTPRSPTPTPHPLPIDGIISPTTIITMATLTNAAMPVAGTLDRPEAIHSWTWAPTGDKLLYVTNSGKLYWCNLDGSNATQIHQYAELYDQLEEQMPKGNTLLIRHLGQWTGEGREPTHMDVIRFAVGQAPVLTETAPLAHPPLHIHWWSPDRASGIAHTEDVGGDLLVTLDAGGTVVEERNIPYMDSGAVQPGGAWLAYATSEQTTNVAFTDSDPQTIYLLNMTTNRRLQITQSGKGYYAGSWSPDGNWFLITEEAGVRLVSADGLEWVTIPGAVGNAVWSPDSKYLAFSIVTGHGTDPTGDNINSFTTDLHIVNIPVRQVSTTADVPNMGASTNLMMDPKWAPNGSTLGLLSFDPNCHGAGIGGCSSLTPALFMLTLSK